MTFISATRLRGRSIRFLPGFFYYALISTRQARRAPGNLGMIVLNDRNRTFWTATAWRNESDMRAFMMSAPHRKAMPKLIHWCSEAAVVHWIQESPALPDWQEAYRRMVTWPNINVDYGPLNLMQGWIELRDESFERDVLGLMSQFAAVCPIIDQLLEERIAPVRQRR
jgi:heme-degrading monooxygenase HmoA